MSDRKKTAARGVTRPECVGCEVPDECDSCSAGTPWRTLPGCPEAARTTTPRNPGRDGPADNPKADALPCEHGRPGGALCPHCLRQAPNTLPAIFGQWPGTETDEEVGKGCAAVEGPDWARELGEVLDEAGVRPYFKMAGEAPGTCVHALPMSDTCKACAAPSTARERAVARRTLAQMGEIATLRRELAEARAEHQGVISAILATVDNIETECPMSSASDAADRVRDSFRPYGGTAGVEFARLVEHLQRHADEDQAIIEAELAEARAERDTAQGIADIQTECVCDAEAERDRLAEALRVARYDLGCIALDTSPDGLSQLSAAAMVPRLEQIHAFAMNARTRARIAPPTGTEPGR